MAEKTFTLSDLRQQVEKAFHLAKYGEMAVVPFFQPEPKDPDVLFEIGDFEVRKRKSVLPEGWK